MNNLTKWLAMMILGWSLFFALPQAKAQPGYSATYQDFYDDLSPYGQWIDDPQYGYVWLPDAGPDFRPYYTNGYWAMTEYGNTWISNYDWGWAPFHYGRWTYDSYYGWLWIPDTEWGPAWVSWRSNNSYYGWAPLGPGGISIAINAIPMDWWIFLSPTYFYNTGFQRYYGGYRNNRNIYYQTTIINNTYYDRRSRRSYYCGPNADDYRRRTGRRPTVYSVSDNKSAGGTRVRGNRVSMYRPSMSNVSTAAPSRIANTDRSVGRRPESFKGNNNPQGRQRVLQQSAVPNTAPQRNTPGGRRTAPAPQQDNGQMQRIRQDNNTAPAQVNPGQQNGRRQFQQQSDQQQRRQQLDQQDQARQQQDQQRMQQQQQQRAQQQQMRQQQEQMKQQQEQQRSQQQQQMRQQQDQMRQQQEQQRAQQQQMRQQQDQMRQQQEQQRAQQQQMRQQQDQMRQQQEQQRAQQQQMRQQQQDQMRQQQEQQRSQQQQQMRQQQEQQRSQQQPQFQRADQPSRPAQDGGGKGRRF